MSTTETDLSSLETEVLERLDAEAGHIEADIEAAAAADIEAPAAEPVARLAIAIAFPVIASAVMTGGVFQGFSPRIYAAIAGIMGIGLAVFASRQRRLTTLLFSVVFGIFIIGALMMLPNVGNIGSIVRLAREANQQGDLYRPPVQFLPGWHAILGWLMAVIGFSAAWVAFSFRKPALALMVPVPFAALGGISVPKNAQVPSGIAVLVLFVFGLGLLSSNSGLEGDEKPPLAYEIRRALRSLPLVAAITVALILMSQLDFLFPKPAVNPAEEPQKPKTTSVTPETVQRPLFRATSKLSGPWRMGSLDVYSEKDGFWRLAPLADADVKNVPKDGVIDKKAKVGGRISAEFEISGLAGAVLPGLSNPVAMSSSGIVPAYDARSGNIRLAQGQLKRGNKYVVQSAALPSVIQLAAITDPIKPEVREFTEGVGDPPPAVAELLAQSDALPSLWEKFDFLRNWVLQNVVATGQGVPIPIKPERVDEIITTKEATPYEIVATQALLARWIGVPSRIAFGFDGGENVGKGRINGKGDELSVLEVRPAHGATFVEVYFEGFNWVPVVGTPKQAKPTVGSDPGLQKKDANILPSEDVTVQVYLPVITPPASVFGQQLLRGFLIGVPILLLLLLIYSTYPGLRKARIRSRRRTSALEIGPRARIALAYAEFRDLATDFGFSYPTDTPLMYLERFIDDDEHTELAWLVTRVLWGDLQDDASLELAVAAEELSRSLRRRLAGAQPATVRFVAAVSRLSLRNSFAPDLNTTLADGGKEAVHASEAA